MRVLVVEDEKKMASFLQRGLKEEGYVVDIVFDGIAGFESAMVHEYDLIILDWMIPGMSGIDLCKKLREQNKKVPVLILTARDSTEDKIKGLDQGADDYLAKPFSFDELLARIRALLRRPRGIKDKTILKCGDVVLDLVKHAAFIAEKKIDLSRKEFALLEFLMRRKGEVVSRTQIGEHVWDLHFDPMSNTIDVYINFLRKKISHENEKSRIETVRGTGYRIVEL